MNPRPELLAREVAGKPPSPGVPCAMALVLAAIGLGSNVGDRASHLHAAIAAMRAWPGTRVVAVSAVHETDPVGPVPQERYLNAAAVIETSMTPAALLEALHAVEASRGRRREAEQRWGPRTLDLDLLLYGGESVDLGGLVVPHPRMHERSFVLDPLSEIAPDWVVPGQAGRTVATLAAVAKGRSGS